MIDEYYLDNAYDDLELREPLKVGGGGIIPITPPDEDFEVLDDTKIEDSTLGVDGETKDDAGVYNIDSMGLQGTEIGVENKQVVVREFNSTEIDVPNKMDLLYGLQGYIENDIINNGYKILYDIKSTGNQSNVRVSLGRVIFNLKVSLESLTTKDRYLRDLYSGDKQLMDSWDILYNTLMEHSNLIKQVVDEESLLKSTGDIDIAKLINSYLKFSARSNDILQGYTTHTDIGIYENRDEGVELE